MVGVDGGTQVVEQPVGLVLGRGLVQLRLAGLARLGGLGQADLGLGLDLVHQSHGSSSVVLTSMTLG